MTTLDLLRQCSSRGIRLEPIAGRLRIEAPTGALTPDLLAVLRERKAELLAALTGPAQERTGISSSRPSTPPKRERRTAERMDAAPVDPWWERCAFDDLPCLDPCPVCGGIAYWWDYLGVAHCERCHPGPLARSFALAEAVERARRRTAGNGQN